MSDEPPSGLVDERRTALLQAAVAVFARYGYRKASMDEVARAAGLSRQGLYLHFPTKEALFREVVEWLLKRSLAAAQAVLTDETRPLEERLVGAFDAMYGHYIESLGATPHLAELFETSARLVGPLIKQQECSFRGAVTDLLSRAGLGRLWAGAGLSAPDLAETLEAVAYGLKHRIGSRADYLLRIGRAVRLVCGPRPAEGPRRA